MTLDVLMHMDTTHNFNESGVVEETRADTSALLHCSTTRRVWIRIYARLSKMQRAAHSRDDGVTGAAEGEDVENGRHDSGRGLAPDACHTSPLRCQNL